MPRKKKEAKKSTEKVDEKKVLKLAKKLGIFRYNKYYRQYEIIVPIEEYEKL